MLPEVFVTDVMEAPAILTEVMIRMGQEAPPFFPKLAYGWDRKRRYLHRTYDTGG